MPSDKYQSIELHEIDSTSRFLKDYCAQYHPRQPVFCSANIQTGGYGQQKRSWVTNSHSAILSMAYPIAVNARFSGLMSLQVAALVHRALAVLIDDKLQLKWPNDLFSIQGKVAGILIEQVKVKDYRALVIGIGINRQQADEVSGSAAVSDFELKEFIETLYALIEQLGLVEFDEGMLLNYWQEYGYFSEGESIKVLNDATAEVRFGEFIGINGSGQALIEVEADMHSGGVQRMALSSGLNSIRKLS